MFEFPRAVLIASIYSIPETGAGNSVGSFGYEQAFLKHFGILYSEVTKEDMINIKRDLKINTIIDERD